MNFETMGNPEGAPDQSGDQANSGVFLNLGEQQSSGADQGAMIGTEKPASKMNVQVLLAGLVFAIGVGAIAGMRQIGMSAGIDESSVLVDYTPETTTVDFVERFDSVMSDLAEASVAVQIQSVSELPERPFTIASAEPAPEMTSVNPMNDPAAARQRQLERERIARERELESLAAELVLQSVLGGSRPVARISGIAVAEGMMIDDTFRVEVIDGARVIVSVEGMAFELVLGGGVERIE